MYKDEYKSKEKEMEFLGHVPRRMPKEYHCATALTCTPMGKRKVGRPKTTWCRTVEKEREKTGWKSSEEVRALAKDRDKWKRSNAALCATEREGEGERGLGSIPGWTNTQSFKIIEEKVLLLFSLLQMVRLLRLVG